MGAWYPSGSDNGWYGPQQPDNGWYGQQQPDNGWYGPQQPDNGWYGPEQPDNNGWYGWYGGYLPGQNYEPVPVEPPTRKGKGRSATTEASDSESAKSSTTTNLAFLETEYSNFGVSSSNSVSSSSCMHGNNFFTVAILSLFTAAAGIVGSL